jgi:hypothetical protein
MDAEPTPASTNGPIDGSVGPECKPWQLVEHIVNVPGLRAEVEILRDEWESLIFSRAAQKICFSHRVSPQLVIAIRCERLKKYREDILDAQSLSLCG